MLCEPPLPKRRGFCLTVVLRGGSRPAKSIIDIDPVLIYIFNYVTLKSMQLHNVVVTLDSVLKARNLWFQKKLGWLRE